MVVAIPFPADLIFPGRGFCHRGVVSWGGMSRHQQLGALGERLAADFLARRGAEILERNRRIGRGELDIVARDRNGRFAVEVKTGYDNPDFHPRWNWDKRKAEQVRGLARSIGVRRVDLVTVAFGETGAALEWHTRVA